MKQVSGKMKSDRNGAVYATPTLTSSPIVEAKMATANRTNSNPVIQFKERPIIFGAESVRAILGGRKTQTRRVMKPQPDESFTVDYVKDERRSYGWSWEHPKYSRVDLSVATSFCPYGKPGDRLWVRESFAEGFDIDNSGPEQSERRIDHQFIYKADGKPELFFDEWKPSIFMYRAASRITLEITNVRVERLQDISEDDAYAEGFAHEMAEIRRVESQWTLGDVTTITDKELRAKGPEWFEAKWDEINGKKHPWSSNPWVWVIEFKKI